MDSSIISASIINFTKNSVSLQFDLFPSLLKYDLVYTISLRELYDPKMPVRNTMWQLAAEHVYLKFDRLKAITTYSVDVELNDGSYRNGVRMKKPFEFRIKGLSFIKMKTFLQINESFAQNIGKQITRSIIVRNH